MTAHSKVLDALIIGAGPSGLGTALALQAIEELTFGVLERDQIGQTFLEWPTNQTFLTPSFTSNGWGGTDLNAIHPETSPAFTLGVDYPDGMQYATYLYSVAQHFQIPVLTDTAVTSVDRRGDVFEVQSEGGPVLTRSLVWAGGEFHDPITPRIPGSDLTDLAKSRRAWEQRKGRVVVIGGYESGMDMASHHIAQGSQVTVVDGSTPWDAGAGSDPSFELAPRTRVALEKARKTGRLTLIGAHATSISHDDKGWSVALDNGEELRADSQPIAATGYGPGLGPVEHLFAKRDDGWPELDENDQSTVAPGLFLSGPAVRHDGLKFCFVYKYRLRFAHIARIIGQRAGKDVSALEAWREAGMLIDDLSCCGAECTC